MTKQPHPGTTEFISQLVSIVTDAVMALGLDTDHAVLQLMVCDRQVPAGGERFNAFVLGTCTDDEMVKYLEAAIDTLQQRVQDDHGVSGRGSFDHTTGKLEIELDPSKDQLEVARDIMNKVMKPPKSEPETP